MWPSERNLVGARIGAESRIHTGDAVSSTRRVATGRLSETRNEPGANSRASLFQRGAGAFLVLKLAPLRSPFVIRVSHLSVSLGERNKPRAGTRSRPYRRLYLASGRLAPRPGHSEIYRFIGVIKVGKKKEGTSFERARPIYSLRSSRVSPLFVFFLIFLFASFLFSFFSCCLALS